MINETVILLTPIENYFQHPLAQHIYEYLLVPVRFDKYFYEPLKKLFPNVVLYDYLNRTMEVGLKKMNEEIIELVKKKKPKYVVWNAMYWYGIRESTFQKIRREGAITIGWFLDDEVPEIGFENYSKLWIPYIDYFVTNSMEAAPKYRDLDAKCILAPAIIGGMPIVRNWPNIEEKYEVSFVGRKYLDRETYINEIKNRNIPIHVFGREWNDGKHISFEEMIDVFVTSKINLNFSKVWGDKKQIKGRIFEVCLAGGFLLTEYAPGIEKCFDIGKEIVCFNDAGEMIEKIIYYLNHDGERRAIAQAGWKRAIKDYTSSAVYSRVFGEIGKDIKENKSNGRFTITANPKMSVKMRKNFAEYYLNWGAALSEENYKGPWKNALALSIQYYPFNIRAWYHFIIGFLPHMLRVNIMRGYRKLLKTTKNR